jgi:hypothetical protein
MDKLELRRFGLLAALAVSAGAVGISASARGALVAWNLVGALDPNNGTSMTISDATSNTGTDGVTLSSFATLAASAFTNNLGGVYNFETGSAGSADTNTQLTTLAANATFGDSATHNVEGYDGTLTPGSGAPTAAPIVAFYRSDANATASASLDWNSNNGAILASGGSGGGYMGIQGTSSYSLTFQPAAGDGVVDFGITDIARSSGNSAGNFTVHFSDGSTINSSSQSPTGGTTTGTFFGFSAPAGLTITSVDFANTGASASRFDDVALVVAPVPEPASLGLLSLGCFALLRRRHNPTA